MSMLQSAGSIPLLNQAHPVYVLAASAYPPVRTIVVDPSRFGPAPRCFFSPFDALLEMLLLQRQKGQPVVAVAHSGFLSSHFFYSHPLRQRPLTMHVAWLAHEARLVTDSNGFAIRVAREQAARWRVRSRTLNEMMIDAGTWSLLDRAHECAGLFAWRETMQLVRGWFAAPAASEAALRRALIALDTVGTVAISVDRATQLAMYDPETGGWHFIPRNAVDH